MMKQSNISIAKDFSIVPLGRYFGDSEASGQRFREEFLRPALAEGKKLVIDLDQTEGYGSSFLEEAFGGLVRAGFTAEFVLSHVEFVSDEDPSLIDEIVGYIRDAHGEPQH